MSRHAFVLVGLAVSLPLGATGQSLAAPPSVSPGDRTAMRELAAAVAPSAVPASPAIPKGQAVQASGAGSPAPCARKVKIVYQGYGEAARACPPDIRPGT